MKVLARGWWRLRYEIPGEPPFESFQKTPAAPHHSIKGVEAVVLSAADFDALQAWIGEEGWEDAVQRRIEEAVRAEREACAAEVETFAFVDARVLPAVESEVNAVVYKAAAAIRSRSKG